MLWMAYYPDWQGINVRPKGNFGLARPERGDDAGARDTGLEGYVQGPQLSLKVYRGPRLIESQLWNLMQLPAHTYFNTKALPGQQTVLVQA